MMEEIEPATKAPAHLQVRIYSNLTGVVVRVEGGVTEKDPLGKNALAEKAYPDLAAAVADMGNFVAASLLEQIYRLAKPEITAEPAKGVVKLRQGCFDSERELEKWKREIAEISTGVEATGPFSYTA